MIRPLTTLFVLGIGLMAPGCSSVGNYFRNRALDITDIVNVKGGFGYEHLGIAAWVEATDYVGTGVGLASTGNTWENFGRIWHENETGITVGLGFVASEKLGVCCGGRNDGRESTLLYQQRDPRAPIIDRFRVGADVTLPFVSAGLFVNLGEIVDFLGGIVGWDPAHDDRAVPALPIETAEDREK